MPLAAVHLRQMSGALRMVPSPEQGTSHRILSNARQPWPPCASVPAGLGQLSAACREVS